MRNRDIMNLTGLKLRSVQRLVSRVRKFYNKDITDYITIDEFCTVFKFDKEKVREYMQP